MKATNDGKSIYLHTGNVLTTEQSEEIKSWAEEAESIFGQISNMTDHEKQIHKDMLNKLSIDTGINIDDFTWDGSGD